MYGGAVSLEVERARSLIIPSTEIQPLDWAFYVNLFGLVVLMLSGILTGFLAIHTYGNIGNTSSHGYAKFPLPDFTPRPYQ